MRQKIEIDKKDVKNSNYVNRENEQTNLKSSSKWSILQSRFFNQTTREIKLLERSQKTL